VNTKPKCMCEGAPDLVFACSGVTDSAEIDEQAARELKRGGAAMPQSVSTEAGL